MSGQADVFDEPRARVSSWPPLRPTRLRRERGSVVVVLPTAPATLKGEEQAIRDDRNEVEAAGESRGLDRLALAPFITRKTAAFCALEEYRSRDSAAQSPLSAGRQRCRRSPQPAAGDDPVGSGRSDRIFTRACPRHADQLRGRETPARACRSRPSALLHGPVKPRSGRARWPRPGGRAGRRQSR